MLTFGIVADSPILAQWHYDCVERLLASGRARLELVLLTGAAMPPAGRSTAPASWKALLHGAVGLLGRSPRRQQRDMRDVWPQTPAIFYPFVRNNLDRAAADSPPRRAELLARLGKLDFLLCFEAPRLDEPLLCAARYGMWLLEYESSPRGVPPGLWEAVSDRPSSSASLTRVTGRAGDSEVIRRGARKTAVGCFANARRTQGLGAELLELACADILRGGTTRHSAPRRPAPLVPAPDAGRISRARLWSAQCYRYLRWLIVHGLFEYHWSILILPKTTLRGLDARRARAVAELDFPTWVGYGADPFIFESGDGLHLLFEYYPYKTRVGRIDALVYDATMTPARRFEDLIPSDVHLSYPAVFPEADEVTLVPEAAASGRVHAYTFSRKDYRPLRSEPVQQDFPGVDNTIFQHGGRYWMFNTHVERHEEDLYLWHAESPRGPWIPHQANPIKTDVEGSRPAGPMWHLRDGTLVRPAQDGTHTYGGGVIFYRVTRLTEDSYAEEEIHRITPADVCREAMGVHHVCASERFVAIDYKVRRFRFRLLNWLTRRATRLPVPLVSLNKSSQHF